MEAMDAHQRAYVSINVFDKPQATRNHSPSPAAAAGPAYARFLTVCSATALAYARRRRSPGALALALAKAAPLAKAPKSSDAPVVAAHAALEPHDVAEARRVLRLAPARLRALAFAAAWTIVHCCCSGRARRRTARAEQFCRRRLACACARRSHVAHRDVQHAAHISGVALGVPAFSDIGPGMCTTVCLKHHRAPHLSGVALDRPAWPCRSTRSSRATSCSTRRTSARRRWPAQASDHGCKSSWHALAPCHAGAGARSVHACASLVSCTHAPAHCRIHGETRPRPWPPQLSSNSAGVSSCPSFFESCASSSGSKGMPHCAAGRSVPVLVETSRSISWNSWT